MTKKDMKREQKILKLWQSGVEVKKIAKRFKVSNEWIYCILKRFPEYVDKKSEKKDRVYDLFYRQGASRAEIAEELGITRSTVKYYLAQFDEYKSMKKKEEFALREIEQLFDQGTPIKDIVARYDCSRERVRRLYVKYRQIHPDDKSVDLYTKEDADKVLALYSEGKTLEDVAIELGMGCATPAMLLRKFFDQKTLAECRCEHTEARSRLRAISEEKQQEIVNLAKQGATVRQIVAIAGVSNSTVRSVFRRAGLRNPPYKSALGGYKRYGMEHSYGREVFSDVAALYSQGLNFREISRQLNVAKDTPRRLMQRFLSEEEFREYERTHLDTRYRLGLNFHVSEAVRTEIIELRQQGLTLKAIAKKVYCSEGTVLNVINWAKTFSPMGDNNQEDK